MYPSAFQDESRYGFEPDGIGYYFHIRDARIKAFAQTGSPVQYWEPFFIGSFCQWLYHSSKPSKMLMIGLEPPHWRYRDENNQWVYESHRADPYTFVMNNLDYVRAIANFLRKQQDEAAAHGKTLEITIRFASEMNDRRASDSSEVSRTRNAWGQQPNDYKTAFIAVRNIFQTEAPDIKFAFSPAIRADLDPKHAGSNSGFNIRNYYPGDQYVDVIGGTWYAGNYQNYTFQDGVDYLDNYLKSFYNPLKPYALDEIGVVRKVVENQRQGVLFNMVNAITAVANNPQNSGRPFDYVNFFLAGSLDDGIRLSPWP